MRVGIHPDMKNMSFGYSSQRDIQILKKNAVDFTLLDIDSSSFWQDVKTCDRFIFRWPHYDYAKQIAKSIIPIIEKHLGIKCFPSSNCSWVYDNKIREFYLLKRYDFPVANSWIFYDKLKALEFLRGAPYPIVFKLKGGAGARSVVLIHDKQEAERYVRLMFGKGISNRSGLPGSFRRDIRERGTVKVFRKLGGRIRARLKGEAAYIDNNWYINKNYAFFQEFLPGNSYDTRVVTIGQRAFAFQRLNRPNDFRASGSNRVVFNPDRIDKRFVKIAFAVSQKMHFETMAYDFLYDRNGNPVILELSYAFGTGQGSAVSQCPGYWDTALDWHTGQWTPEYLQMVDFLNRPDLKMPSVADARQVGPRNQLCK